MKIIAVLILFFCFHYNCYSQNVTLSVKNTSLEKVFAEIKKQTNYNFVYQWELLQNTKPVDIDVRNASLEKVLEICLKDQQLSYKIVDEYIIVSKKEGQKNAGVSSSSTMDVKGRVQNENGDPMEGITVAEKGTDNATASNTSGGFVLKGVDPNATLVFSGVNIVMEEIKLAGNPDITVNVKTKITTNETVVVEANTGYQKIKPNETTGSLYVVDNQTINEQTGTNILQRLDGVASSVYFNIGKSNPNPQNTTNISIRGLSTINGPLDPLIVLDNFIYEGDINNINPNDVENITVLKDAAATSIYGARGGNGVIVITTKKGRFNQKLKIDFNSNILITQKTDYYSRPQMSVSDYIDVEQFLFTKGYFDSDINDSYPTPLTPAVEVFLERRNGEISAVDSANKINALKAKDIREQYNKYLNRDAVTQQYSLSLRGGSGNIAWLISGNYYKSISSLFAKSNQINLRINNTYKPIKNLLLNIGIYYTRNTAASGANSIDRLTINRRDVPYLQIVDDFGNALSVATTLRNSYTDTAGRGRLLDWKYYPLEEYKQNITTSKRENLTANIGLNYQVFKSLNLDLNYQYQKQTSSSDNLATAESFKARDIINSFTRLSGNSNPDTFRIPRGAILGADNSNQNSWSIRSQLNFNKGWNKHVVSAIAGFEIREVVAGGNSYTLYGYNKDPFYFESVDFVNRYPDFITGSYQFLPGLDGTSGEPSQNFTSANRFASFYSNLSYLFRQRYSLSGSIRRDASNSFGLNTNDKWNPLWSTGLGWELSKENFYKVSWIPSLKLKITWGYSGNVDLNKTAVPILSYSSLPGAVFPNAQIGTLNDPNLRWEKVRQINIGFDFSLKKQIIEGNIEYYNKSSTDLYGRTNYDYTTFGFGSTIPANVADMKGEGVDIVLRSKNINKVFKWTTQLLFNYNTSKTTKYYDDGTVQNGISILSLSGSRIRPVLGKPLYALVAWKWGGLNASGDPQGFVNGQLSADYDAIQAEGVAKGFYGDNIVYIGPANPTHFGAFINRFSWRQFSVAVNITYRLGYYFKKPFLNFRTLFEDGKGHPDFAKRWQKPGDELITNIPAMVYTDYPNFDLRNSFYNNSEINVLRGDHIRLQYINVAYSIQRNAKKKVFENLELYANVANLGIIWRANKEKLDPENLNSFQIPKSFTMGMRASF